MSAIIYVRPHSERMDTGAHLCDVLYCQNSAHSVVDIGKTKAIEPHAFIPQAQLAQLCNKHFDEYILENKLICRVKRMGISHKDGTTKVIIKR